VVSESFLPTVNGVTTSVCRVLESLRDRGDEAVVIAPTDGDGSYAGFPVVGVPAVAYRRFPVGLPGPSVQRTLEAFGPDLVHAASPFLLGAEGIAAARRLGVPTVAVYQTDVAGYALRHRWGRGAARLARAWVRRMHEQADLTLAPSSAALAELTDLGVPRLARWGRGVDLDGFHPNLRSDERTRALRRALAPDGQVLVGYVGRLAPEKRVERLRALRGMRGIRVVIVGDGPAAADARRALHGVPTTFLGQLTGDDLRTAYAALDLFVHTGTEETFGQTIQEAQASGCPVVAPRAGGPIDLVEHGHTGLLYAPEDDVALARAVASLVADPARRARIGEAGRRAVRERSWEHVCAQLFAQYDAVIARRAATLPSAQG